MFLFCQLNNEATRATRKTMWVYPRPQFWFKDLAQEQEKSNGVGGIVNRKK